MATLISLLHQFISLSVYPAALTVITAVVAVVFLFIGASVTATASAAPCGL